jgi:hypothetical protein
MPRKNPSRRQRPGASLMHQNRVTLVPKYRSRPFAVCANFKVLEGRASNSTEGGIGCVPRSRYYQTSISDRLYALEGFVFAVESLQ